MHRESFHRSFSGRSGASLAAPVLVLAATAAAAWAQAPDAPSYSAGAAPAPPARSSITALMREAYGAALVDGEIVAGGPDWKARFPAGRAVFTPALGTRAERNLPLAFAFECLSRGGEPISVSAAGAASLAGERISFQHSGGVAERYDATERGLLLSFVVPEQPEGTGDLVVRGRVETDLPFAGPTADGGLAFELAGIGGVHIGGVTAIDAGGDTAAGELRYAGERLELVVPAAFVDAADYPLVIDPEIGPMITIDGNDWDDGDPDVAASTATRYLVVWERRFSLNDVDIRGYRLDDDGGYEGSLIYLEGGDELSNSPAVASVRVSQRYFVAWQETPSIFSPFQIVGRAVDAGTGALSSKLTVAASANQQTSPDVGGERTTADDDVFVVWGETVLGVRGRQVSLPASGADPFTVGSTVQISDPVSGDDNASPVISKSAGDTGRFGLAYHFGPTDVMYRTISRNGDSMTGAQLLAASIGGPPHREPAIDGDGTSFLLAFERTEPYPSTSTDIWGATLTYDGLGLRPIAFQPIEADDDDEETNPDVAFTGGQFLVAYIDVDATANAYTKTIDPFTCLVCESESSLSLSAGAEQDVKIAAHYAAGLASSEALHVWESFDGDGDLLAQVYESPLGQQNLFGGCGDGGDAATPCPYDGNGNFAFHLGGAEPFAPAFLALAFQQSPVACGLCTLWPSLATADVFYAGMTDAYGRASLPVALPDGTSGVGFTSQWAVVTAGGTCPLFGVDVSNGVATTIQL